MRQTMVAVVVVDDDAADSVVDAIVVAVDVAANDLPLQQH